MDDFPPRIEQQKRPRAKRALRRPLVKTALPKKRRLLVAQNPRNRYPIGQPRHTARRAKHRTIVEDLRHHHPRNPEQRQQIVVPRRRLQIHQKRSRSIRRVGRVRFALRKLPQKPAIDGPKTKIPLLCRILCVTIVEYPPNLRCRKIRIAQQPRLLANHRLNARRLERLTRRTRSPALPHNRRINRLPRLALPHNRRFALVRNPNPHDLPRIDTRTRNRRPNRLEHRLPNLVRAMLNKFGFRIKLLKFLIFECYTFYS